MRILVVSGSARRASLNTRLGQLVAAVRPGDTVEVIDDLDRLPFYDADVEAVGVPAPVRELRRAVAEAAALVVVTPEYNGTVPGLLGNALDWLSRPPGRSVLRGRRVVVLSASPSRYGAIRAAEHLRAVLGHIGADVAPAGVSVPRAHERLANDTADRELATEIGQALAKALDGAEALPEGDLALAV